MKKDSFAGSLAIIILKNMNEIKFKVNGFHCESCVKLATMKIRKIGGVESVDIKDNGEATINANREVSFEELSEAVAAAGHTVSKI
jgi:copper chaperone CopZ